MLVAEQEGEMSENQQIIFSVICVVVVALVCGYLGYMIGYHEALADALDIVKETFEQGGHKEISKTIISFTTQ